MHVVSTPTARATLCLATAALLITGCASQKANSASKLPKLLIATGAAGVAPAAAAAIAPGTDGGPETRMGIFAGYVIAGTLPDQPTHAPIYLWPSTKPSQSDVVKLATALGLSGTPKRHAYGWEVTTSTGDLRVRDDHGQQWSYDRADTEPCPAFQIDVDHSDNANFGVGCAVAPTAGKPANGPDEAATKAAATGLLAALGLTGDDQFNAGAPTSYLNVSPEVAGLPTQGIDTNINVDARGITAATGQLQAPSPGDDYPLQTAKAAFDSIAARPEPAIAMYCGPIPGGPNTFGGVKPLASAANQATIASAPPAVPSPAVAPSEVAPSDAAPSAVAPPTPIAPPVPVNSVSVGSPPADATAPVEVSPVPCPTPEPIKVTGAHLGLEIEYNATSAGATILVPSWFYTLADGSVARTAIAVDPSYLGTPPEPTDVATTDVAPVGPAGSSAGFSGGAVTPVGPAVAPSAAGPSAGAPAPAVGAPKPASS